MPRRINLRQIEAFKAMIENGTVSGAAQVLNISQPAMSKLIAHLEFDTGLNLFNRIKGRLVPTEHAALLHDEVDRIFAGVRQVENAVESIRRAEQVRLAVGAMFALSGSFIQRATTAFLESHRNVFCSFRTHNSQVLIDLLIARKIDVGLVGVGFDSPYVALEPLMEHPLVCVMPLDHPLAHKKCIEPQDLDQMPFVSFDPGSYAAQRIDGLLDSYNVRAQIVLVSTMALTLCEFVAAGLGVSLVHPLMASGLEHRLAIRRFEPEIPYKFQLGRNPDSRNLKLVDAYMDELRATAAQISGSMLREI